MKSTMRRQFPSWLLGTAVLLVGLLTIVLLGSGFRTSRALVRGQGVASAGVENPAVTVFLPAVWHSFEYARLAVTKSVDPTTVLALPGQVVTYSVTIANAGDTTGRLLTVYDTLPRDLTFLGMAAGSDVVDNPTGTTGTITWTLPLTMAPGDELWLRYRVSPSLVEGQYINQVGVTAEHATVPDRPASATVTVEPNVLLQENFDSGIDRWTPFLNWKWRLEPGQWYWGSTDGVGGSGALTHDCCVGDKVASDAVVMYLEDGAEGWTDYRVETRLLLRGGVDHDGNPERDGGDPIGLWVRGQWEPSAIQGQWLSGYYVLLDGGATEPTHRIRLSQMQIPGDCTTACGNPNAQYAFNNPMILAHSAELPGPFEHYRWYTLAVEVRGNRIQIWLDGELVLDYVDDVLPFLAGTVGYKAHETQTASFDDIVVTRLP